MTSMSDRFVQALRALDGDAMTQLLAPDAMGWRNLGDRTRTAQEIIATLGLERTLVRESTLDVRHESSTLDGFVVQLVFAGTTHGGADFRIPICIVARVADGRISHFDEYADEASVQPLQQELLRSGTPIAPTR
jgi:ketosteroid isomerase-like protein